jgi:hypothetical protein
MSVIYTTTTKDEPEYKALLCGRTEDITTLIDHVAQGQSMAMFGERRIGKTSVLYLLRDIINGSNGSIVDYQTETDYQAKLIDSDLKNKIADLQAKIPHYKSFYIDFQTFQRYDFEEFVRRLYKRGEELDLLASSELLPNYRDIDIFDTLNAASDQGRLVVLIDEIEVLENFPSQERMKVVSNLSRATTYPNLCFIIAGAENWYDTLKDDSSPLSRVLKTHPLPAPSQSSTVLHLIREPLEHYLPSQGSVDEVVATVQDWTGCKPFYVQTVCASVVKIYQEQNQLPPDWKTRVRKEIYKNTAREVLKQFYGHENIDVLAQDILALLANLPNLTAEKITDDLGYDRQIEVIQERLNDLVTFDKIRQQDGKYHIVGTLIEEWGLEHKEIPAVKSPSSRFGKEIWNIITSLSKLFSGKSDNTQSGKSLQ